MIASGQQSSRDGGNLASVKAQPVPTPGADKVADKLEEILHGKSKLPGIMKQPGRVYS